MPVTEKKNTGTLYLVPTPIGNLGDITLRAIDVLRGVDLLLTEDSRVTRKLLTHFDIKTPLRSYHKFNEKESVLELIELLQDGKSVALVSDAGMPGISDPGMILATACHDAGINVTTLPGASAGITALISSGFRIENHLFVGFLPKKKSDLEKKLGELKRFRGSVVIYESPHRIQQTLKSIANTMPKRLLHIAREMTKFHEEHIRGTSEEVCRIIGSKPPRGEYAIILAPSGDGEDDIVAPADSILLEFRQKCMNFGLSVRDSADLYSFITGVKRSEVYNIMKKKD
jgi:16S rRNA (cytidine1402-2'-O)-methyltransferase